MGTNRYGKVLTIILVILVVAILIIGGVLLYNYVIKPKIDGNRTIAAITEFDKNTPEDNIGNEQENQISNNITEIIKPTENVPSNNGTQVKKKTYYEGYVMLGYITIEKTGVKEPILDEVTPEALEKAVAVLYPSNPKLNQPGNVVIIGHNYRNGKFFSNNKNLSTGDKIKIKDATGKELTYTIYQKFTTTEEDTSFYARDTKGATEVTLSTCTDDAKERIIILARVEQ